MNKIVKSVDLIFENCESVRIKGGIGYFHIGNIVEEVNRIAVNTITRNLVANEVYMQFFKQCQYEADLFDKRVELFNRIAKYNDITQINVNYKDGSSDKFLVDYDEENEDIGAPNVNQKTMLTESGTLYIVIDKDKTIEDVFDLSLEIEDENSFLDHESKSRYDLAKGGWSIIIDNDDCFEMLSKDAGIVLTKNSMTVIDCSDFSTIKMDQEVASDLMKLVFNSEYIYVKADDDKYDYLPLQPYEDELYKGYTMDHSWDNYKVIYRYEKNHIPSAQEIDVKGTLTFEKADGKKITFKSIDFLRLMWINFQIKKED